LSPNVGKYYENLVQYLLPFLNNDKEGPNAVWNQSLTQPAGEVREAG
jgi:hypothetical protein